MYELPFIKLPATPGGERATPTGNVLDPHGVATEVLITQLTAGLRARAFVPMTGLPGAGKTRLLRHLARAEPERLNPEHVLYVSLPKIRPKRKTGKYDVVSALTMQLLSRLLSVLRKRSQWRDVEFDEDRWRMVVNQDGVPTYGLAHYEWVTDKVALGITKLPIFALLIDNAELDLLTLDYLHHFWQDCGETFGVAFCKDQQDKESRADPYAEVLGAAPHIADCCVSGIFVPRMTYGQFDEHTFNQYIIGLRARLGATVNEEDVFHRLWKRTQGNWRALAALATLLDQQLGDRPAPRTLSQEMIDAVFNQLDTVRQWW